MDTPLIHDRGRGPEIAGTRITIYNLVPHLLSPDTTEQEVCELYHLTPAQVAAARAYYLNHYSEVTAENARIGERLRQAREAQDNDPVLQAMFSESRETFRLRREWAAERKARGLPFPMNPGDPGPTFPEWLATRRAGATGAG